MAVGSFVTDPTAIALTLSLLAGATTGTTEITDLSATASGKNVSVSGSASFGEAPVMVGEDPVGDNTGGSAGAVGLDIEKLFISQPTADSSTLLFTIKLASLTGGGLPDSVQYNWDIAVNGGVPAGGTSWSIKSARTSQYYQTGSVEPYAGVHSCVRNPDTGVYSCTARANVPAVFDPSSSEIRISVPLSVIQAGAGADITAWPRNGDPVWVQPAALGAVTPGVTFDGAGHEEYTVPTRTVRLGIAPAGTPVQNVSFSKVATVNGSGGFSGTVTAPSAGSFDAWARACFGATCDARSDRVQTS
jgi:hypothetical protein